MKGKKYVIPIGVTLALIIFILVVTKGHIFHDWKEATCVSAKYCTGCEKIKGEPLGHSWQEAGCLTPKTCSVCGETEGVALGHDWDTQECTSDWTCQLCGEVKAAPGHSWIDATCELAQTCSVCAVTEGNPLGHSWQEATCELPRTCSVCAVTEGNPLGHTHDLYGVCTYCGDSLGIPLTVDNLEEYFSMSLDCDINSSVRLYAGGGTLPGLPNLDFNQWYIEFDANIFINNYYEAMDSGFELIVKVTEPDGVDIFDSEYIYAVDSDFLTYTNSLRGGVSIKDTIVSNQSTSVVAKISSSDFKVEMQVIPTSGYIIQ